MLSLVDIGKAELKPTASTTNAFFMQTKARIEGSLFLNICKILAKGWIIWLMDGLDMHTYGTS